MTGLFPSRSTSESISDPAVRTILATGEIQFEGQFVWGSNHTFLTRLRHPAGELLAVYKPQRGERPLWDFPDGTLAARELAAWQMSEALGWQLVPPTVFRRDGPAGPGSVQLFLDLDPDRHYFTFSAEEKALLRPAAVFDLLINNADRKGGHILLAPDRHVWLIDHGVCFHQEPKLRTVIWDFAGEPVPDPLLSAIERFRQGLEADGEARAAMAELLSREEVDALVRRAAEIVDQPVFPFPGDGRPYPWPLV
ncbi:MAG TPA: SCO1664 family protein [Anaerolineales bacterium]|nr:SCO1664 family protein [Anaerolineales bacterium]